MYDKKKAEAHRKKQHQHKHTYIYDKVRASISAKDRHTPMCLPRDRLQSDNFELFRKYAPISAGF